MPAKSPALPRTVRALGASLPELGRLLTQFSDDVHKFLLAALTASGTWTPVLTNSANVDASTAYAGQYARIGGVVIASCRIDVDPTAINVVTQVRLTLPVASNFGNSYELAGVANAPAGVGGQTAGTVKADPVNDGAILEFVPPYAVNNQVWLIFQYRVL